MQHLEVIYHFHDTEVRRIEMQFLIQYIMSLSYFTFISNISWQERQLFHFTFLKLSLQIIQNRAKYFSNKLYTRCLINE